MMASAPDFDRPATYDDSRGLRESMRGIYRRSWMAPQRTSGTANPVLLLGGIESHSDWFAPLAARLNARGVSCFTFDRRGWGRSEGERGRVVSADSPWEEIEGEIRRIHAITQRQVHVVGQSWSGMALLGYGRRELPHLAQLTLIAPGIFPRRVVKPSMVAQTAMRTFLGDRTPQPLPLKSVDLSESADVLKFIDDDSLRVTAVPSATLWITLRLILKARALRRVEHRGARDACCILTRNDRIIDSEKTARLMERLGIPVRWAPPVGHCIALGEPEWTADCIDRRGAEAPSEGRA